MNATRINNDTSNETNNNRIGLIVMICAGVFLGGAAILLLIISFKTSKQNWRHKLNSIPDERQQEDTVPISNVQVIDVKEKRESIDDFLVRIKQQMATPLPESSRDDIEYSKDGNEDSKVFSNPILKVLNSLNL